MAITRGTISSALATEFIPSSNIFASSTFLPQVLFFSPPLSPRRKQKILPISAALGGEGGEAKKSDKKKFITKEQEPEQYWQTAGEREGENPMKTPLPYIIIFGMSTPFIILAVAFANGWIKAPIR